MNSAHNQANAEQQGQLAEDIKTLEGLVTAYLMQILQLVGFSTLHTAIKQSEAVSLRKEAGDTRQDVLTRALYFWIVRAINIGPADVPGRCEDYAASLHHKQLIGRGHYVPYELLTPTNVGDLVKTSVGKQGHNYLYLASTDEGNAMPTSLESKVRDLGLEIRAHEDLGKLSLPTPTPLIFDREAAGLDVPPMPNNIVDKAVEEMARQEAKEKEAKEKEAQARALLAPYRVPLNQALIDLNLKPIDVNTLATQGLSGTCQGYSNAKPFEHTAAATGDVDHVKLSQILGSTFNGAPDDEDDDTLGLENLVDYSPEAVEAVAKQIEAESVYIDSVAKLVLNVGLWSHGRGWWNDLKTGEYLGCNYPDGERPKGSKAVGEQVALIHTEVSEAYEGHRKNKPDEHCQEFLSLEVELADALIRILDMAYGLKLRLPQAVAAKMAYNHSRPDHSKEARESKHGKKS